MSRGPHLVDHVRDEIQFKLVDQRTSRSDATVQRYRREASSGAARERVPRGAGVRRLIPNKRVVDISALAAATDAGLIELTFAGTFLSESGEAGVGDRGANYGDPVGDVLVYG